MNKKYKTPYVKLAAFVACMAISYGSNAGMEVLSDEDLGASVGQALFVSDKIGPTGAAGSVTDNTYYRMGLDVKLGMNMNIDKLQLGCGGVNDGLVAGVCDIDLDYVRFMGRGSGQTSPDGKPINGAGTAVSSDFMLYRPYIELAVKNDNDRTRREVVGVKIGAQKVDGFMGIGSYVGGVHTGINSISGYLSTELSGRIRFTSGLGAGTTCLGPTSLDSACAGEARYFPSTARSTGTRMTRLQVTDAPLTNLHGAGGLISLFSGSDMKANIDLDLDYIHAMELINTPDFFLSFQRQQIAYPKYDKTGYAVTANTGWWMNVPAVSILNLDPPEVNLGCPGFLCLGLLDAFGSPGLKVTNPDLGSRPPKNCYGNTSFC